MRAQPGLIRRTPVRMHNMGYRRPGAGQFAAAGYLRDSAPADAQGGVRLEASPKQSRSGAGGLSLFGWAGKKMVAVFGTVAVVAGALCYGRGAMQRFVTGVAADERVRVAIASGDDSGALQWLDDGASVEGRDQTGFTPLMSAALKGDAKMVAALLERGADPNANNGQGWTVMSSAAAGGNEEVMKLLLSHCGDLSRVRPGGNSPLYLSVVYGHESLVTMLLKAGADPNGGSGEVPLVEAADAGNLRLVRTLLNAGASVDRADQSGRTALAAAEAAGRSRVATALKNVGAHGGVAAAGPLRRKMIRVQRS